MDFETSKITVLPQRRESKHLLGLLLIAICLAFVPAAIGQGVSGHIVGTVEDSSHAVIPNAVVTISNQDTGVATHAKSNAAGEYRSDNLPPGTYKVEVDAAGFKHTMSTGDIVTVDNDLQVDLILQVGTSSQTVEVTAANPLVDTTNSSLGEVIDEQEVEGLPLNGRVFSQLIITVPGAVAAAPTSPRR